MEEEIQSQSKRLKIFLRSNSQVFEDLITLKEKGWENVAGDAYFDQQRQRADSSANNSKQQRMFFNMMRHIGDEMQAATGALQIGKLNPHILDLCMAPGGYSSSILKYNPSAQICGVSLPTSLGGHKVLVRHGDADPRVKLEFLDLTMMTAEIGDLVVPANHPDANNFNGRQLFPGEAFDLSFCDGQVLRTHQRAEYRERTEASRLTWSQLIFALQRIQDGGTLVILLHKVDAWMSARLLFQFKKFSRITLFKPERKHATRGSFYLIAQELQVQHPGLIAALAEWKTAWYRTTFTQSGQSIHDIRQDELDTFIAEFGDEFIRLAEPIWDIQKRALSRASFT